MSAQVLALCTALSYAAANVSVRRALKYSTPMTATLLSLITHTVVLGSAVFMTGGIPEAAPTALLAIAITGALQPVLRFCHYTGIDKVGAPRAVTLRGTYPILSVIIGIVFLREEVSFARVAATLLVVAGIVSASWKVEDPHRAFRWWHLLFPFAASLVTGIVHPIRRYAMTISNEPLFFAALVGPISLVCSIGYLALPTTSERLVWDRKAFWPFFAAGLFETVGALLMLAAFAAGPVGIVSPITATSPIWTLIMAAVFLRDLDRINVYSILGTLLVVAGVIAIAVG